MKIINTAVMEILVIEINKKLHKTLAWKSKVILISRHSLKADKNT